MTEAMKPSVILFDVYETLLDMSDVKKKVNATLNNKLAYTIWFELIMEYCFVDNSTGNFHDFESIVAATLQMTAARLGVKLEAEIVDDVLRLLQQLPVKEEVQEGLSRLHDLDFRIAALTNVSERTVLARMEPSGLVSYFEGVFSAEKVKKYKPAREVYLWTANKLEVEPSQILLVTAHGWDLAGAAGAGLLTAWLHQGDELLYPLAPAPLLTVTSLNDLAFQLGARLRENE